jgi:hypothetical protein
LVDPSSYASGKSVYEQEKDLEYKYYVEKVNLKTIQEFADYIIEIYKWTD